MHVQIYYDQPLQMTLLSLYLHQNSPDHCQTHLCRTPLSSTVVDPVPPFPLFITWQGSLAIRTTSDWFFSVLPFSLLMSPHLCMCTLDEALTAQFTHSDWTVLVVRVCVCEGRGGGIGSSTPHCNLQYYVVYCSSPIISQHIRTAVRTIVIGMLVKSQIIKYSPYFQFSFMIWQGGVFSTKCH